MQDTQLLQQFVEQILSGHDDAVLNPEEFAEENRPLAAEIRNLALAVIEMKQLATHLANGKLDEPFSQSNLLLGPLKDLQSNLRHMLWQVECLAQGDYSQRVAFLGDFSIVFNALTEQVRKREELQISYYQRTQEIHHQLRGFRHDLKNHCLALDQLLAAGSVQEAKEYINTISRVLIRNDQLVNTGNPMFDAILSEKLAVAKEHGILAETQLSMVPDIKVSNFSWCVLLGNSWDNAIEACQRLPDNLEKQILFKVKYHKSMLNVTIINTALPPQLLEDGTYLTSKENENHGIGVRNMMQMVDQYDGVMQTRFEDGRFTLSLLLCGV